MVDFLEGLEFWRRVRWLMVARMVWSWCRSWSGTGGGGLGDLGDWRVEERW